MYKFENKVLSVPIGKKSYKVKLHQLTYFGGGIAIEGYMPDGEPFSTLTVNIPEHKRLLAEDEVFIKNWSENESFAQAALQSGYFLATGKKVATGFVEAPVWLLVKEGD